MPRGRAQRLGPPSRLRPNVALALRLLVDEGPMSRARLATRTGFTRATASALVAELVDAGLVHEDAPRAEGARGRPSTSITPSATAVGLGLHLDVDFVAAGAVDLTGGVHHVRRRRCTNADRDPRRAFDRLARLAADVLDALDAERRRVVATAVAVPGLVGDDRATLVVAPNLGWRDLDVAAAVHERLAGRAGGEVLVDNEANLAALGELWPGNAPWRDFLLVSAGVGVGAGLVHGGELFRGAHGFGGELGHFVVDPRGAPCRCGSRGCLETRIGAAHLPAVLRDDPAEQCAAGDRSAQRAVEAVAMDLAPALTSAVHLLDPEAVLLGGLLAPLTPWLRGPLVDALDRHVLGARAARREVVAATLGADAAVVGAAATALRTLLAPSATHTPSRVPVAG